MTIAKGVMDDKKKSCVSSKKQNPTKRSNLKDFVYFWHIYLNLNLSAMSSPVDSTGTRVIANGQFNPCPLRPK